MWARIELIKNFYNTQQGRCFSEIINNILSKYNYNSPIGIGYHISNDIPCIIPASQGLVSNTALAHENMLPIINEYADFVLIMHTLEYTRNIKSFLQEVYRILKPNGRAIFVFPNLYAKVLPCHEIFISGQLTTFIKVMLIKNSFTIVNSTDILPAKGLFQSLIPGIISVIEVQKRIISLVRDFNQQSVMVRS